MYSVDERNTIMSRLQGTINRKVDELTSFLDETTNDLVTESMAREMNTHQEKLLATQLIHSIDHCDGVDEDDLRRLGLADQYDPEDLNRYLSSGHLDELAKEYGLVREDGERSTGTVEVQVSHDEVRVYEGTEVATRPDNNNEYKSFFVDADDDGEITTDVPDEDLPYMTPLSGETTVEVPVIAEDVGPEYDVNPNTIQYLPSPPNRIQGIDNPVGTSGGKIRESDEQLKFRIRSALFGSNRGSTARGVEIYALEEVDGINDIYLDEYPQYDPIYVDVVTDGGSTTETADVLDDAQPSAMRHIPRDPEVYRVAVRCDLLDGDDTVDASAVETTITEYLQNLDLGEDIYRSNIRSVIMDADDSIQNIEALSLRVSRIDNERHRFFDNQDQYGLKLSIREQRYIQEEVFRNGTAQYPIEVLPIEPGTIDVEEDNYNEIITYTEGTDYQTVDPNGEGYPTAIEWLSGGSSPSPGSIFKILYKNNSEVRGEDSTSYSSGTDVYDLKYTAMSEDAQVRVPDGSGGYTRYEEGVDFGLVNPDGDGYYQAIDWSVSGGSPADGETMNFYYEVPTVGIEEVRGTVNDADYAFEEPVDYDENRPDEAQYPYVQDIVWDPNGTTPDPKTEFTVDYLANAPIGEDLEIDPIKKISPDTEEIDVRTYTEAEIYG